MPVWDPFDIDIPVQGPQTVTVGSDIDVPILVRLIDDNKLGPFRLKLRLKGPAGEEYPLQGHLEGADVDRTPCAHDGNTYWFMFKRLRFLKAGTYMIEVEAWNRRRWVASMTCHGTFEVVPGRLTTEQEERNKPTELRQRVVEFVTETIERRSTMWEDMAGW
ncbi:hypothetical protein RB595_006875 [Gaeumannomyces hyphopodioides]